MKSESGFLNTRHETGRSREIDVRQLGFQQRPRCSVQAALQRPRQNDRRGQGNERHSQKLVLRSGEIGSLEALAQILSIVNFGSPTPSPVRCSPVKVEGDQASGTIYVLRSKSEHPIVARRHHLPTPATMEPFRSAASSSSSATCRHARRFCRATPMGRFQGPQAGAPSSEDLPAWAHQAFG